MALLIWEAFSFRTFPAPKITSIECVGLVWEAEEGLAIWHNALVDVLPGLLKAVSGWSLELQFPWNFNVIFEGSTLVTTVGRVLLPVVPYSHHIVLSPVTLYLLLLPELSAPLFKS